jgi:hypothetical protein
MKTATAATTKTGIDSNWQLEHCEHQLPIRLFSPAQPAGEPLRVIPRLCLPAKATRFVSREVAELIASRFFPNLPVEIVRVDA